jgi:6-hydroxy-3-succinoylpyridine 3-monooxygenase
VPKLRTRIYIDGYNLYYGCLRQTRYKWLDVLALFEDLILPSILYQPLPDEEPASMELVEKCAIKYFTADILERVAKGDDSVSSQAQYHNALRKRSGDRLAFVKGYYASYPAKQAIISADDPKRWPRDCEKVQVWKIEEKQSDVNLALQIYDDALQGELDQVVLVTNDTDLVPAFEMLKTRCPQIVRGLVVPTRRTGPDQTVEREANASLANLAHWVRKNISEVELQASQLPDIVKVEGERRSSVKPHSWYARPDNLARMIDLARPVLQKEGKIMSWAREENKFLAGQRPIELIETDEGAQKVFAYIEGYIHSMLKKNGAL